MNIFLDWTERYKASDTAARSEESASQAAQGECASISAKQQCGDHRGPGRAHATANQKVPGESTFLLDTYIYIYVILLSLITNGI